MRFVLRLLMTLVGIVAFFAMVAFGGFYAYGAYGAPLLNEQIQKFEDQIEEDLEEEHPGADITIDIEEVFYKLEGGLPVIAFEVSALAELNNVVLEDTTTYAVVEIMSVVTGNPDFTTYEASEWDDMVDDFTIAPSYIFDGAEAKAKAMTYLIISASVFVGSIVVKIVFLRKKRL